MTRHRTLRVPRRADRAAIPAAAILDVLDELAAAADAHAAAEHAYNAAIRRRARAAADAHDHGISWQTIADLLDVAPETARGLARRWARTAAGTDPPPALHNPRGRGGHPGRPTRSRRTR